MYQLLTPVLLHVVYFQYGTDPPGGGDGELGWGKWQGKKVFCVKKSEGGAGPCFNCSWDVGGGGRGQWPLGVNLEPCIVAGEENEY